MAKALVLLCGAFPFQTGEEFLVEETKYYNNFEKVLIIPTEAYDYSIVKKIYSENITICKINNGRDGRIRKFLGCMLGMISTDTFDEIEYLRKTKRLTLYSLRQLSVYQYTVKRKLKLIKGTIDTIIQENGENNVVIYCYWLSINAKIALTYKKKYPGITIISRCHGGDLYEYRYKSDYLPFRREIMSEFDCIYSISENGKAYLSDRYKNLKPKIKISRLGTPAAGLPDENINDKNRGLRIVSCSYCRPLKRIDKIIDALSTIKDVLIEWTHIGAGDEFEFLQKTAKEKLPPNISSNFMGYVPNDKILEIYKQNRFHVFINVSETEGVPVSIMEALSCGVPIIATDVGGVSEMVIESKNGFLLDKNFLIEDLKNAIMKIYSMNESAYQKMRESSYSLWDERYNSTKNYTKFVEEIQNY